MICLHRIDFFGIGILNGHLLPGGHTSNGTVHLPVVFIYSDKGRGLGKAKTFLYLNAQVRKKFTYMGR